MPGGLADADIVLTTGDNNDYYILWICLRGCYGSGEFQVAFLEQSLVRLSGSPYCLGSLFLDCCFLYLISKHTSEL
jgi:hypothetical protein